MVATSASCGSFGSGVLRRDCRERRADLMVRTGDQAEPRVSRQIAPCKTSVRLLCHRSREGWHTVCELTLGCHSRVSNFITGGLKGYSAGILMSTTYLPPAYGVSGGPGKVAFRCVRSSLEPAALASMLEVRSFWMSPSSFAMRRMRLLAMVQSSVLKSAVERLWGSRWDSTAFALAYIFANGNVRTAIRDVILDDPQPSGTSPVVIQGLGLEV